jgi:hypothetical protein
MPYASWSCFPSVVILIIQVENFPFGLIDSERDPPVASDGEAPGSLAVAGKLSPRSILRLAAYA